MSDREHNPRAFPSIAIDDKCGGMKQGPTCVRCGDYSLRKVGRQWLCAKHYRFWQMRADAKRRGLSVPSRDELANLTNQKMNCPDCGVGMNWLAKEGQATVVTLQHYRDGSFGLVCRSCNTRHAFMPADSFRESPKDHKWCPKCETLKPTSAFAADNGRSGPRKLKSWCRQCSHISHTKWRLEKRDYYNQQQRRGRARRSAARLAEANA